MATRAARAKQKQNEDHTRRLMALLLKPSNKVCADCGAKGIHRSLGVHISKVRSVNLDTWAPEWVESMEAWGNDKAADEWEYHLPKDYRRPADSNAAMEVFIRDKYERCRYKRKASDPPRNASSAPAPAASTAPVATTATSKRSTVAKTSSSGNTGSNGGFANFANFEDAPAPKPAAAPATTDLLDLFGPSTTAPAPAPAAASVTPAAPAPAATAPAGPAPAAPPASSAAATGKTTTDDILALFNTPAPAQTTPGMQFVQQAPQQQAANPFGMAAAPPTMMGGPTGQPMMGQPMMGQPMMGQPMMGQPMMGQPMMGGYGMQPAGMQPGAGQWTAFGNAQQGMASLSLGQTQATASSGSTLNTNLWQ